MTGYSFSTPAVATGAWNVNGPEDKVPDWDAIQGPGVVPFWCAVSGLGCAAWRRDRGARLLVIFRVSKPEDRSGSRARVRILPVEVPS